MPRLWSETVEDHRREVREAILDAAWQLVRDRGLRAVTMSDIAGLAGIGRATLYKYYPNVDAILEAHHERHIGAHLERLRHLSEQPGEPWERLTWVLEAYALICYHRERHGSAEVFAMLHRPEAVEAAEAEIATLVRRRIQDSRKSGEVRTDTPPRELATYCVQALKAAGKLSSEAAVRRLVTVTLTGIRAPR